ncbi:MerR family DNA-binding protein [Amycolatopsis speibonae]|uniref:MerR family DNA-binding protein n=1 Tax=Amycolatopsis speibonae TaxID=1450224 RepID=A0ABV7NXR7_9PSEU
MGTEAMKAPTALTMSQVTSRPGVRPDTVRYYERIGLLPVPARTTGAHRRYDEAVLDRLRFIRGTQRLGLTLTEIGDLLSVRDTGVCPCEPAETMLERHLAEIEAEMTRLGELRAELTSLLSGMSGEKCADPLPGAWRPPDREPAEGGG